MAIHMLAMPKAPRIKQATLMPMANQIFSLTIAKHLREILMPLAIFKGSSSISTTSAASIAASDPMAPMAIPISARDSTGASLMPSPTKASLPRDLFCSKSSSTIRTLSAGISSLRTSSIPNSLATCSATLRLSPESMTVFWIPAFFTARMVSLAWALIRSEMTMWPWYSPLIAMWTIVPTLWQAIASTLRLFISFSLPAATSMSSILATTPCPLISWMSLTRSRFRGKP